MIEPLPGEVTDYDVIVTVGRLARSDLVGRGDLVLENLIESADRNNRNDNIP